MHAPVPLCEGNRVNGLIQKALSTCGLLQVPMNACTHTRNPQPLSVVVGCEGNRVSELVGE